MGNCLEHLKRLSSNSVDLILTSPPYDDLRTYGGNMEWNLKVFKKIAKQLARVLKDGGVIVWNVADRCVDGGYSCNSYRQVLYFTDELGLKLHDTMIWEKQNPFVKRRGKRYHAAYEPMFVFSKGEPKTFNPIMRECKHGGEESDKTFVSNRGNGRVEHKHVVIPNMCIGFNVWNIPTATSKETTYTLKDGRKIKHTAVFPKELAARHIKTWSNEGDIVLDPFMGSGTSGIAAVELGRSFIGCELNEDYCQMAKERIQERMSEVGNIEDTNATEATQNPLKRHLKPSDVLSHRQLMKVKSLKGRKHNLYIQRVECSVYDTLGFSQYHCIDKPINKAAMCFLVTTAKGQPLGFLGFLNHTFKGCPNGMMVSRFVILPQFQHRGLTAPILGKVCGMLRTKGYRVYLNTENPKLGEMLLNCGSFKPTTFNGLYRDIKEDRRYRHRRSGTAYRLQYCGERVYGYGHLLGRVADMRAKKVAMTTETKGKIYVIPTPYTYFTCCYGNAMPQYTNNSIGICADGHIARCKMPQCSARGTPTMNMTQSFLANYQLQFCSPS